MIENKIEVAKQQALLISNYVIFAEKTLEKYAQYRQLIKSGNIDIQEVNQALSDYKAINDFLIAEYERKCLAYNLKKDEFDEWFAEKYFEARKKLNPLDLASGKWASSKEIEMQARIDNKDEYRERNSALLIMDREVATLRRLCDSYKRMDSIFQTLSNNWRAEYKGESLVNRMNTNYEENNENENKGRTMRRGI